MDAAPTLPHNQPPAGRRAQQSALKGEVAQFQQPDRWQSLGQLASSFIGLIAACAAMYALLPVSYWLVLPLIPVAAGFVVRIFIIQHDCGHRAFFVSRRANDLVGYICSLATLTPYPSWRRQHAGHHGVWNDLDRRDSGADIYSACLTVEEYRGSSPAARRWYRITRHPLVANLLLPPLVFLVLYRFPFDMPKSWRHERRVVHLTTLAIVAFFAGLGFLVGFEALLLVQLPVSLLAAIIGVWLFAVQHRGAETRWSRNHEWTATGAALEGSNYLRLPRILQWFTGNIGFHHIHHLNPRVPNYRLPDCHRNLPALASVPTLTFPQGLKAMLFVLWDERRQRMITLREERKLAAA